MLVRVAGPCGAGWRCVREKRAWRGGGAGLCSLQQVRRLHVRWRSERMACRRVAPAPS